MEDTPPLEAGLSRSAEGQALLASVPSVIEALPLAAYACDAEGRIRWYNARAAALWGRSPALGDARAELPFCGALQHFDRMGVPLPREMTPLAQVLRSGRPLQGEELLVARPDGSRARLLLHVEPLRDAAGALLGAIACFHEAAAPAEESPPFGELRSRRVLEGLPAAIYTTDATGHIVFYNQAAVALWGCRPELGRSQWCGSWRLLWPDGRPMAHNECPMALALQSNRPIVGAEAVALRPDGVQVPFLAYPTPLHDEAGRLIGAVNMLVDITRRKQQERQQRFLINELNHRVKNSLAIVQSIVSQSLRQVPASLAARQAIEGRLVALAHAHDLLTESSANGAVLADLARLALSTYCTDPRRFRIAGPPVHLPPKMALSAAMALHELCTNATKYGALSGPRGSVAVTWELVPDGPETRLQFRWEEIGGPPVQPPTRKGFGTRLIERGLIAETRGEVQLSYRPEGLVCTVDIVLPPGAADGALG